MCKEPLGLGRHYWGEMDCPYFEPLQVPSSIEEYTRELEEYWKDIKDIPTGRQPFDLLTARSQIVIHEFHVIRVGRDGVFGFPLALLQQCLPEQRRHAIPEQQFRL